MKLKPALNHALFKSDAKSNRTGVNISSSRRRRSFCSRRDQVNFLLINPNLMQARPCGLGPRQRPQLV